LSTAELTLEALKKAKQEGLTVSCDLNFIKNLWNYGRPSPEVMGELMNYVDIAVGNKKDCQNLLG
jgi:2-dehydro-3-deoxygluconokinase